MPQLYSAETVRKAQAELELRARAEREELRSRYDWYGDVCECGLPLGECKVHPRARPSQRPPGTYLSSRPETDWRIWLLMAGRAFGKTRAAAEFVTREVMSGRVDWVALVNATVKDVRDVQIEHPRSGLLAVAPPWFKPVYEPSKARVSWPNGAFATIYSAEQPGALRGPGFRLAWPDEIAKWEFNQAETFDNLEMCLREAGDPMTRMVITSTPQPTETFKAIVSDPRTIITRGSTWDNASNLDPGFIARMREKYGNTRLGRQELEAHLLEDVPGALWKSHWIDPYRLPPGLPGNVQMVRAVVAIDPSAGSHDPDRQAECGIAVCALGDDGHGYLLADYSMKGSPREWGKAALRAYQTWRSDRVIAEKNNGGDMVEHVIRTVESDYPIHPAGRDVPFSLVHASRGKQTRAEPVANLYEQGRVHHCGRFDNLESQLCTWVPGVSKQSPDRLDALVWGFSEVMPGIGDSIPGHPVSNAPTSGLPAPYGTVGAYSGRPRSLGFGGGRRAPGAF
jgi:phage terminase large subunit-like protein